MNNLKETNIRKAIWHIRRHLNELLNSQDEKYRKHEMFHLKSSIECLERVMNNEKNGKASSKKNKYIKFPK